MHGITLVSPVNKTYVIILLMDYVQEIKDKLPIEALVGEYVTLKNAGIHFKALCPFHSEKTPSFIVTPERGTFHCFGCGKHGDIFTFLQEIEGVEFKEALKRLADKTGVEITSSTNISKYNDDKQMYLTHLKDNLIKKYNYFTHSNTTTDFDLFSNVEIEEYSKRAEASFPIYFDNDESKKKFNVIGSKLRFIFKGISDEQLKIFQYVFDMGFGERTSFGAGFMVERWKKK